MICSFRMLGILAVFIVSVGTCVAQFPPPEWECVDCWCIPKKDCPDINTVNNDLITFLPTDPVQEKIRHYSQQHELVGDSPSLNPPGCQSYPDLVALIPGAVACDPLHERPSVRHRKLARPPVPGQCNGIIRRGLVCGFKYLNSCGVAPRQYELDTYASKASAKRHGAIVTHEGPCGVCSNAQDLAVFLNPLLDMISRQCALQFIGPTGFDPARFGNVVTCFLSHGMTMDCALLWTSNALNTGVNCWEDFCRDVLMPPPGQSPVLPNDPETCELNPCLQCDEDESGDIFQCYSGRTRRKSGIVVAYPSTKRDCDDIANLGHDPCEEV